MFGSLKGQAKGMAQGAATQSLQDPSKKRVIFYGIISLLLGGVVGLSSFLALTNPNQAFLFSLLGFLTLGVLHVWAMYSLFSWAGKGVLSSEIWFTVLIAFLMLIGYAVCYFIFNRDYTLMFTSSVLVFILPLLVHWTFNFAISIPPKEYKQWFYPEKQIVADMENMDVNNFAVITFIFSKKDGDKVMSNFQIKAPYQLRFGDLFYFFIQEWNHKNPSSTIQFLTEDNRPFGWYFYIKKSWWQPSQYMDADFTIRENKIGVNAIIITERIRN